MSTVEIIAWIVEADVTMVLLLLWWLGAFKRKPKPLPRGFHRVRLDGLKRVTVEDLAKAYPEWWELMTGERALGDRSVDRAEAGDE